MAIAVLGGVGVVATPLGAVWAQQATALDRFDPAPSGDRFPGVPDASAGHGVSLGMVGSYAHEPLVARRGEEAVAVLVDRQLVLHLGGRVDLARRLALWTSLPFVLDQGGTSEGSLASPDSAAVGDLRLGFRFVALEAEGAAPALGLGLEAWLPTGDPDAYAGTGQTRWSPRLGASGTVEILAWTASLAPRFEPLVEGGLGHSEIELALGIAAEMGPIRVGPETVIRWALERDRGGADATGAEARLAVVGTFGPLRIGAAAGPGLAAAPGTPVFRAVLGVAVNLPFESDEDARNDEHAAGIEGDGSPRGPGEGAPRAAAPPRPAALPVPPVALPDGDRDGVADAIDACLDRPGRATLDRTTHGCPAPAPAPAAVTPCAPGGASGPPCQPARVVVDGDRIGVMAPIPFRTGSADLDPAAESVLAEIAALLASRPDIARVAVDGHTDDVGDAAKNVELSQRRSLHIVQRLIALGIDARRLEARGFGSKQPLAKEKTPEARARNRRVELIVRKRTDRGAEGWVDGPLD